MNSDVAGVPPRFADAILEGLGAPSAFTQQVIGDLHESFHELCRSRGEGAARRWYWMQTLHALPHAFVCATRAFTWRGAGQLIGNAVSAWVVLSVAMLFVGGLLLGVAQLFNLPLPQPPMPQLNRFWWMNWVPVVAFECFLLGYVAAWLDRVRPIATAMTLAAMWCAVHVGWLLIQPEVAPLFTAVYTVVISTAIMGGALWKVRRRAVVVR